MSDKKGIAILGASDSLKRLVSGISRCMPRAEGERHEPSAQVRREPVSTHGVAIAKGLF